jgi:Amino acid transporters
MAGGEFKRAMGLVDATAIVIGSMIGSGIFIVSADVAVRLGSPGWLLLTWLLAGFLTVTAAACYGELASMMPHAGGQYVFLREAYGKRIGFLYGWTLFTVIQSGTNAAVAVAFAKFLGVFVPMVSAENKLFELPLGDGSWVFSTQKLVGLLVILLLTAINCGGIHLGKIIQTSFTTIKVVSLFLLIGIGLSLTDAHQGMATNFVNMWQAVDKDGKELPFLALMGALSAALVGPLFASDAWNNITFAGEEVKEPRKTMPKALILGTGLVTVLYILTNVVYLMVLPLHGIKDGATVLERGIQYAAQDRVGTAALQVMFGGIGEQVMAVAIMISVFGALNGLILSGPRLYYAMAQDKLFFKKAGELNVNTNVPVYGLVIQGIWSAALATSGTYGQLLDFIIFAALLFYVLTVYAVIVMRKKHPEMERPFKVPLYPILPISYIVLAVALMIGQICVNPGFCGAGLAIILTGLPVYMLWTRKNEAPTS